MLITSYTIAQKGRSVLDTCGMNKLWLLLPTVIYSCRNSIGVTEYRISVESR